MADKQSLENIGAQLPLEERALDALQKSVDFVKRNQTATYTVLGLLLAGVVLWFVRGNLVSTATDKARNDMGQAYALLGRHQEDSAAVLLQKLTTVNAGLETSKAALLLADIQLSKGQLDKADKNYRLCKERSNSVALLEAGALRGLAVCAINRKDYKTAESLLSDVLSKYQRVTGDAKARGLDKEPKDLVPFLSQVQWQLVLVKDAQNDAKAAKEAAEKLIKLYPTTEEAQDARRFLAMAASA